MRNNKSISSGLSNRTICAQCLNKGDTSCTQEIRCMLLAVYMDLAAVQISTHPVYAERPCKNHGWMLSCVMPA